MKILGHVRAAAATTAVLITLGLAAAPASALTLNFDNTTSETSNSEFTGASGTVEMVFSDDLSGDVRIDFTVSNTTDVTMFGDGATSSKLTGFGFDLLLSSTIAGVQANFTGPFPSFILDADFNPYGTLDVAWADNNNFIGGNANAALPEGSSDSSAVLFLNDSVYATAAALEAAMGAAFAGGDLQAGLRFQQVNAGAGSDKLNYTGTQMAPIPLPAAGWVFVASLGGLAALRRRS